MVLRPSGMEIHFTGRDYDVRIEAPKPLSVRKALSQAGILASTVIVSIDGVIIPHSTVISQSAGLLVTTISSGG
jgi:sulfur carrier protein ThiS